MLWRVFELAAAGGTGLGAGRRRTGFRREEVWAGGRTRRSWEV